jgi:hypothetical protein
MLLLPKRDDHKPPWALGFFEGRIVLTNSYTVGQTLPTLVANISYAVETTADTFGQDFLRF